MILENVIAEIVKLTENNHHTEAVLELAKYLQDAEYIAIMKRLNAEHILKGYMTSEMIDTRRVVLNNLFEMIGYSFGEEWKQKVYNAF